MRIREFFVLVIGLFFAVPLLAKTSGTNHIRDPFWPLGFSPSMGTNRMETPIVAPQPTRKVITAQDWEEAEIALGISATKHSMAAAADGSAYILLWGRVFPKESLATSVYKSVEFTWRVTDIREGHAVFSRVRATEPIPQGPL